MRSVENINQLVKKLRRSASADLDKRVRDDISSAPAASDRTESAYLRPKAWRIIMTSSKIKLAAAAVVMIAALSAIYVIDGSSVTLAEVLERIEQIEAYRFKMNMKVTGSVMQKISPWGQDMTGTFTISKDLGMKWVMEITDSNTGLKRKQENYIIPDEKLLVILKHEKKQFLRTELNDDLLARMKKQNNDPREMIRQMLDLKYTELGKSAIDGVEVYGFETTDPAISGGTAGDVKVTLWVDSRSWLPMFVEGDMSIDEQGRIRYTIYDYQWDIPLEKSDFEPAIPEDYDASPKDGRKWPEMTEEAAIEGLRLIADLMGRYPKQLSIVDLMHEISPIMYKRIKKDLPEDVTDTELETKMLETTGPVYAIGLFYMTLVEDKKEPVYYGQTIGPDNVEAVLLRWKISDDKYRVIFGDLSAMDATAEQLEELEK